MDGKGAALLEHAQGLTQELLLIDSADIMVDIVAGDRIEALIRKSCYQNFLYSVKRYDATEKPSSSQSKKLSPVKEKQAEAVSPHLKHSSDKWKAIWWFEDYNETLLFLYELFFAKQQASRK